MDYIASRSSTAEKLKANGKTVDLQYMDGATVNGTYEVPALELKMSFKDVDGTNVRMGDKLLMIAALSWAGEALEEPKTGDRIVSNGIVYTIVQVYPLSPGNIPIYYEVLCRG